MAIPVKQSVQINFSGGLDTKTDPNQIGPAEFLVLNNMAYSVPDGGGGARLSKANGFGGLTTSINTPNPALTYSNVGASLTNARKIFSYNNELLLSDSFNLYSYDESTPAWNYKGRQTAVSLSTSSIVAGANTWLEADCSVDTTSGIKVFAYFDANGTRYSIQDTATGQLIVNQALLGVNYTSPRCISISGKSWILAVNSSTGHIDYQAIVGQTVTGSPTTLISNLNSSQKFYDVDVDSYSGNIYIAYFNATPGITISALSTSLVVGNTITEISESATHGISWFGDGANIWIVYNNGTATKGFIVNNAVSATILATTVIDSGASNVNNVVGAWSSTQSKAFIFYDPTTFNSAFTLTAEIIFNTMTVGGTIGTPTLFMGSVNINSKAFAVIGIPHLVALYTYPSAIPFNGGPSEQVIQPTNFLLNLYNVTPSMGGSANNDVVANIAAKISPDQASPTSTPRGRLTGIHQNSSGAWELALLQGDNFAFEGDQPYNPFLSPTGVIDCQFDFSLTNPDAQSLGNNAVYAGAQVSMYDGGSVVEQNFHIYPNSIGVVSSSTSGGAMGLANADSTYSYIFVYEWIDNQGQVHRSFPSPVITPISPMHNYTFASGVTAGSIVLNIPALRVTEKSGSQVVVNVYRTVANGSVYFLLGSPSGLQGSYGTVINDPSVDIINFTDIYSDSDIQGNIQLYTTGALGYYAPPATSALTSFKNRALSVASEDPYQLGYSNAVLQNFPVQFVPEFLQNIGTIGGPLVTVAQMDDKMIFLKNGKSSGPAIYYMVGQGPAPSGASNDFQDPIPVTVDAGCVDRASVVLTPPGIMFKSNKGIYLLDRGLTASYIGGPVEAYNQYTVISAQLIPDTTQVRFLLLNAPASMLIYDYYYKRWCTRTSPSGISDCIFQGQHTYVSSTGQVYQETPGIYVDGTNTPVLMNFTTAWIKLAGLQGYQRSYAFFLLAEFLSAHKLQLQISYDFSQKPSQTTIITPNSSSSLENWRVFLAKQRCQSFQIALQEIYGGTPGAGLTMSGLNLIVGAKNSFRTISAAQSVG